jgi:triacylglycerol lipase
MYFPANFDLARSVELARLVVQAYDQLDSFQKGSRWMPTDGYTLIEELVQKSPAGAPGKTHTQFDTDLRLLKKARFTKDTIIPIGFIAQKDSSVYVVFRGTVTIAEWVRNLNVRLSNYPRAGYGKVHEGFLETYSVIHDRLLEVLADKSSRRKLFIAGHSVGAALATLALPEIEATTGFRAPTMYTFGSPRVGDNQFCTSFDRMFATRSFRIVNTSDMIVSLPLPVPIIGIIGGYFSHVDTPVDFTVQEDALEKNHVIGTYLSALLSARKDEGVARKVFRWPFAGR